MNKTVETFLKEMARSPRIKEIIIKNISDKEEKEMTLNLFDLDFDFYKEEVIIYYYAVDKDYPPTTIKNEDFLKLLQH